MNTNRSRVESRESRAKSPRPSSLVPRLSTASGFSLVEVLVVITLLSLIVLALMAVFNSTQTAFRSSVTQTDVLEGGRAAVDMMTADLRQMAPSFASSNGIVIPSPQAASPAGYTTNAVNFYAGTNLYYSTQPLSQSLAGSAQRRTNVLDNFFILSRGNLNGQPMWFGTGYAVNPAATNDLYPLYRFYLATNVAAAPNPAVLFNTFMSSLVTAGYTNANWSHLLDGVVVLTVRAYDPNGMWITNGYTFGYTNIAKNVVFLPPVLGGGFCMFSNTLPAAVEVELGVLEDRTLQRAESLAIAGQPPSPTLAPIQWQYLQNQAGKVHLFRQRVTIRDVDPSAYQ